jgi:hypothetical protein
MIITFLPCNLKVAENIGNANEKTIRVCVKNHPNERDKVESK